MHIFKTLIDDQKGPDNLLLTPEPRSRCNVHMFRGLLIMQYNTYSCKYPEHRVLDDRVGWHKTHGAR
jgi:hypothetical protein